MLVENQYDVSSALTYFADELSNISQYTTLVVHPNHKQDIINNVHLIRANPNLVIMVIVFSSGHVEHVHLASDIPFSNDKLNTISNFVTNKLTEFNQNLQDDIVPQIPLNVVDVRDVAELHILAMTNEQANGKRFIATADGQINLLEIAKLIKEKRPEIAQKVSTKNYQTLF